MKAGELLNPNRQASAFCGEDGTPHPLGIHATVIFLGVTRYNNFKAWEAKVLTEWGPAWMWVSDLHYQDGSLVLKTNDWLEDFRQETWHG